MILQVSVFAEASAADVTLEGPGTVVHVHMRLEVSRGWERLCTQCTFVRLLLETEMENDERRVNL